MTAFLGVDGGGTKTGLSIISERGDLLASLLAPSCYYLEAANTEGLLLVERVLGDAIPKVCAAAGVAPAELGYAFVGLPGYGEVSADLAALDALPARILGHDRYRCGNDMICGWAGSLGLADGINVVSGTGTICYGRRGERSARVGGWGELIGDEGSGYWIATRALQACSRMSDGREPVGPMLALIADTLDLATPLDLVDVVHTRWHGDRGRIAALTPLVVEASRAGDVRATSILAEAAAELVLLVETTRRSIGFPSSETAVVSFSGGVFGAREVTEEFTRRIDALTGGYELRRPLLSPVLGAAAYAARLSGQSVGPQIIRRLAAEEVR